MARCCQGDRDLLCEGHLAQTDIRLRLEDPVPQLDTLEQGFSYLVWTGWLYAYYRPRPPTCVGWSGLVIAEYGTPSLASAGEGFSCFQMLLLLA